MTDTEIFDNYHSKLQAQIAAQQALESAESAVTDASRNYDASCIGDGDTEAARRRLHLAEDKKRGAALTLQQARTELESSSEAFRAERERQTLQAERDEILGLTARAEQKEAAMKQAKAAHDAAIRENQRAWADIQAARVRHTRRAEDQRRGWR